MPLCLIIHGHPSEDSFCQHHTDLLKSIAESKGYEVKILEAFKFPLIGHVMHEGYGKAFEESAELFTRAEIIGITFPVWNYSLPGGLKNFLDGSLQARKHFHFQKVPILNIGMPVGHLTTKKIISLYTTDGPKWFYRIPFFPMDLARLQIKRLFSQCGIKCRNFKFFLLGNTSRSDQTTREKWLQELKRKLEALV